MKGLTLLFTLKLRPKTTISEHFSEIKDPRIERNKLHNLIDIIRITLCAVITGAKSWLDIELFGQCKYKWFKSFLELPNGIPSHDTFNRVFSRINPKELEKCFSNWMKSTNDLLPGEQIAIDGKTLRRSHDKSIKQKAIVMVSAFFRQRELVLAQEKVNKKSNEITAVPKLLKVLKLSGAIVSLDAIGCQRKIVNQIVKQKADYLITLKKNQKGLYKRVNELFKVASCQDKINFESSNYHVFESSHGRIEKRCYSVLNNVSEIVDKEQKWSELNSIVCVEYLRKSKKGKTKLENRYYITSLSKNAEELAEYVRGHWSIENQLHWILDVTFGEDNSRIRKDNAPENLAVIRHIALNLLKLDKSSSVSIKGKRNKAGWDDNYLLQLVKN